LNPLIRRLGKVLGYSLLTLVALFGVLLAALHLYQDKIIGLMVAELNKSLTAKVEVAHIRLSAFDKFPQLALSFDKLKVHGSLPGRTEPLAVAERFSLTFDLWDLLGSRYVIDRVYLENADVQVYLDQTGEPNYNVFRKGDPGTTGSARPVAFDLNRVSLRNVQVRYTDRSIDQEYDVLAQDVAARLVVQGPDVRIQAKGDLRSRHIRVNHERYFAAKPLRVDSELGYDLDTRRLTIEPSLVFVRGAAFEVMGQVRQRPRTFVDLKISGKDTDVQTVLSLLPEKYTDQYAAYRSQGDVYFSGTVTGHVGRGDIPGVNVRFGCRDASFFEQNLGKRITAANLTGTYTNGKGHNRRTSSLHLRGVTGRLQGKPFAGNFSLSNFENPYLKFDVRGELDVTSLVAFVPQDVIRRASGSLRADVKFEGNLSDLRSTSVGRFVRTSGQLGLRNVAFALAGRPLAFHGLNGDFSFSKSDLVVNDFHGRAGASDFRLNGWFKNVLPYLLLDGQHLRVEADFASRFLNFDELLAAYPAAGTGTGTGKGGDSYRFVVSPRLALDLTCRVDRVKFRRFRAQEVQGDLVLAGSQARSRDIRLRSAGGTMSLSADVDARQPDALRVDCDAAFHNIAIDSVFYMFENFDQTFIQDRHLRGSLEARVRTGMVFNSRLDMNLPRLTADVQAKITDGQLNDFEPMQKLSKFINRNELANLRFAELENTIRIERETVFLPKMEISSNVANILAEGTHTFSQVMDYHLRIPVNALLGKNRGRGGVYEASTPPQGGKSNLFLFVRGPADSYKIGYDSRAVADKIVEDIKSGKRDTRNGLGKPAPAAPRSEGQARTQPEAEEEFFDFQ
jgi:hypothetical protein